MSTTQQIRLKCGDEIRYIEEDKVKANLSLRGYERDQSLTEIERSDVTKHVYEGGFKVWECSVDLCEKIDENKHLFQGKRILELGCGAGLPGILGLKLDASHLIAQDFNECVLRCFTVDNLNVNGIQADSQMYRLLPGSWDEISDQIDSSSCDIILTSETIYNENDYEALHNIIAHALTPLGFCWLAAKMFYFGVGGNIPGFVDYITKRDILRVTEKWFIEASVSRCILEIRRKA